MAKQTVNLGTADRGNGDRLRDAFKKINENFDELYSLTGADLDLGAVPQDILPELDDTYRLGSASKKWKSINISDTILLDGNSITVVDGKLLLNGSEISTGDISIDGGAAATVYEALGLNIDGGAASTTYALTISGGGA